MKKWIAKILPTIVAALAIMGLSACSGGSWVSLNIVGIPTEFPIGQHYLIMPTVDTRHELFSDVVTLEILDDGGTGATLNGNMLTTNAPGVVIVEASVQYGLSERDVYFEDFTIIIRPDPDIRASLPYDALISEWYVWRYLYHEHSDSGRSSYDFSYERMFNVGARFIGDRPQQTWPVITRFVNADFLIGSDWLQVAMDGRQQNVNPTTQMMFTAKQDITVHLLVEHRVDVNCIPWLDRTWEFMGLDVMVLSGEYRVAEPHILDVFTGLPHEGYARHYIFRKDFAEGEVFRMGHLGVGTTLLNMFVVIQPQ